MSPSRRQILSTLGAGALAGLMPKGVSLAFAAGAPSSDLIVVIFLRGAMDGLHLLAPLGDPYYPTLRNTLRAPTTGADAAIPLSGGPSGAAMHLTAGAAKLKPLYDSGALAFVHASGLRSSTRSHFDAQARMEHGYADGETALTNGWLGRHLAARAASVSGVLPIVAIGSTTPISLDGASRAMSLANLASFTVTGGTTNAKTLLALTTVGASAYQQAGSAAITAIDQVASLLPRDAAGRVIAYQPANGAVYGNASIGTALQSVAQIAKLNLGLSVATIDFGGWDTHTDQNNRLRTQFNQLSQALDAFWTDMASRRANLTVIAMTEFGRRGKENANVGTDHGHGSVMIALGGAVNGGRIHGDWPGLAPKALDQGLDLAITTDYRQVLAEMLMTRGGATGIGPVFPTMPYRPIGLFKTGTA